MMPGLGPKKKEILPKMDRYPKDFPQLSNEMQLSIMNKVKSGELSIEDALKQARMDMMQMHKEKSQAEEEQYNFSVHKHTHYRWQKRVLQIDFKTKMLCNIEKGIVKRQFPFSTVRSCDDAPGSKFSISFSGHHDYELEATSVEDKQKMIQLVNQIIYRNIYNDPEEDSTETCQQPEASQSLREGVLLLHRGGLASFRWVKYEVKLHPGELALVPLTQTRPSDVEVTPAEPVSIVIHLSDGDTSVQKPLSTDAFTLITHKNKYQFRVPIPDQTTPSGDLRNERDAWVEAIDKLCLEWRRKSKAKDLLVERKSLQNITVAEETENTNTDLESNGGSGVGNTSPVHPSVDYENADPAPGGGDHLSAGDMSTSPPSAETKPIPRRRTGRAAVRSVLPPVSPPMSPVVSSSSSPLPPSPDLTPVISSTTVPESPPPEIVSSVVKVPSLPSIPPPPPLPCKLKNSMKAQTKAFHWDVVGSEKIDKSFWKQESSRRIEIDKSRLFQQFVVKDQGKPGVTSHAQQIMLNEKIAHNFNIFLKSFPLQPGELKDRLFIVSEEEGGLSDEHITSLRRYVPTLEDIEMYKSHKGPVTELHIVDQYMMEMCNIPCLSTQLDLLLTLRELPITMNDLQPLINQKIRMCTELNNSRSFVAVLEYLLAIGNYLNENARKGKAKGIRLSSLAKLSQLRGRDKKFTLLHALVEQIMLHEPCLATFTQELAEFETVPGASIKGLTAEVDVLKNELQKIVQYTKKSKRLEHQKFFKDLKAANEKYNTDLSLLTKTCEEMKKLYSAILVKFGEPVDQDSQELFGLICQFIHDFKRARAEMI